MSLRTYTRDLILIHTQGEHTLKGVDSGILHEVCGNSYDGSGVYVRANEKLVLIPKGAFSLYAVEGIYMILKDSAPECSHKSIVKGSPYKIHGYTIHGHPYTNIPKLYGTWSTCITCVLSIDDVQLLRLS